jgi:hypothetical protein
MCGGDLKNTNFGLMPWKGEASLVNQGYIKPRKDAEKQAKGQAAAEAQRQARISANVGDINKAFDGREAQYADLGSALRERFMQQLGQQRQEATRQNKFALARSGLTGGSAAVDAGRLLARENQEGVLGAERMARSGVANLRTEDENARSRLISLAQSGNDIGNAGAQSAALLQANLGTAQNSGNINDLGEVFGRTAAGYRAQRDAAERRRGLNEATTYARSFSRN